MKILLFGAFTAFCSNIGRFHEILEFLMKLKAKNIDEALDIGIYELSVLATKLKQNFAGKRNLRFLSRFLRNSSMAMVQTHRAD